MFIVRWLSIFLVVVAVMLMGADLVSTLEKGGALVIRPFGQILILLGFNASTWAQTSLPPQLVSAAQAVLSWPGWLVVGVPGGLLAALSPPSPEKESVPETPPIHRY